ncbi:MAG TPA: asparagine synthase-related protein [Blastocatellia bacterium]|nr:asparagine synthase-related protein [Blastocatellia bacterium]
MSKTSTSLRGTQPETARLSDTEWLVSFDAGETEPQLSAFDGGSLLHRAEADGCATIFYGALYNARELSGSASSAPEMKIDPAELILRGYLERGEESLGRLRGTFALVIWDARRRVLLCARDPAGVYPLFYARAGRKLLLSTSIETLIRCPEVSADVNRVALAEHLAHRWANAQETFYESVNRLLPGHALRVDEIGQRTFRYWDPTPDGKINWVREGELELFNERLDSAIERCSPEGRPAIFLSGGFDSVSVAAIATARSRARSTELPLALSLVFPHPDCNEEVVQKGVAERLGIEQVLVRFDTAVGPKGLLRSAMEMSAGMASPLLNVYNPAYCQLAIEGKRRGCDHILTGGGGDEWLTVSPYYAADLLSRLDIAGMYRLWKSMNNSFPLSKLHTMRNVLWRFSTRVLLGRAARNLLARLSPELLRARRRIGYSLPDWIAHDPDLRREMMRRVEQGSADNRSGSIYIHEMRRALDHTMTTWEMEEVFETSRRTGARVLQPYWDADLVELLYRTPPELLNRGGRSKALVRQSVARRFPELGFEKHKKVVATNFFGETCMTEGARLWADTGGVRALAKLGVVDAAKYDSTIRDIFAKNNTAPSYRAWDALNLEAWCRPRC